MHVISEGTYCLVQDQSSYLVWGTVLARTVQS